MQKNSGLGRGLDALFSESTVLKEINEEKNKGETINQHKDRLQSHIGN